MSKTQIYLIVFLLFSAAGLMAYYYIFNIYEVIYTVSPKNLFADNFSQTEISAIPVNALGKKVPFRHSSTQFDIIEGKELIDVVREDRDSGKIVFRAKNKSGKIIVSIKARHSVYRSTVEIYIYPNFTETEDKTIKKT